MNNEIISSMMSKVQDQTKFDEKSFSEIRIHQFDEIFGQLPKLGQISRRALTDFRGNVKN